ncbi:MAG: efflux RND transporter periplasmic adaptor subunit [Puniceicoccales bacterium]
MNVRFSLAAALAALFLAGCPEKNEFVEPPPPTVTVAVVEPSTVTAYDTQPGQLAAMESVDIVARVTGFLESKDFESGVVVDAGKLLFTIDSAEFTANVQAADARLASATAKRELAKTTYERNRELFATQAISELELLQSEADYDLTKGGVEEAEASLERAKLDLSYTQIKSPIEGRVARELVTVGNLVGPGENAKLTSVVSLDPIYFYFNADERMFLKYQKLDRELKEARSDAKIPVTLELANGEIYSEEGEVDYASNHIDVDTGTIEIRAIFPNPDKILFPGMFGNVRFAQVLKDVVVVPEQVIQKDLAGDFVLVVDDSDVVEAKYVKKGPRVEEGIVLNEGLEPGARLIVNGIQKARPGAKVNAETQTAE